MYDEVLRSEIAIKIPFNHSKHFSFCFADNFASSRCHYEEVESGILPGNNTSHRHPEGVESHPTVNNIALLNLTSLYNLIGIDDSMNHKIAPKLN